ncbi:MAG: AAA domain-containing protein, partial [Pseudomonadales bacterium]
LDPIRDGLATGGFPPSEALDQFEFACAEAVWGDLCEKNPELDNVDGDERTELVERFGKIDSALKALAAQEISLSHYRSLPRGGAGQMGILKGEIGKKRRHMALRKLMDSAGEAISKIKPVFLMSPLSVAQYLRPGGVSFDLLVMDEASQIRPEDALGAILRSKQIVVVGDRHQLPPTSFFSRMTEGVDQDSEAEEETPQAAQVGDMESVLTLCAARSIPGETLRWHYRSKHPSLIAVSNQTFYENRLVFPPSPELAGSAAGLT